MMCRSTVFSLESLTWAVLLALPLAAGCDSHRLEAVRRSVDQGDLAAARSLLESTGSTSQDPAALILLGRIQLLERNIGAARTSLGNAASMAPSTRPEIAHVCFESGTAVYTGKHGRKPDPGFAVACFDLAFENDPRIVSEISRWILGQLGDPASQRGVGDLVALVNMLARVSPQARPALCERLQVWAVLALDEKDPALAFGYARALAQMDPQFGPAAAEAMRRAALQFDTRGDSHQAREALVEMLRLDPRFANDLDVLLLQAKLGPEASPQPAPAELPVRDSRSALEVTVSMLRNIDRAIQVYVTDENRYPSSYDPADLERLLSPEFIRLFPRADAWGKPFRTASDHSGACYRIISAGEDGIFESGVGNLHNRSPAIQTESLDRDIIFENGNCVQCPSARLLMEAAHGGPVLDLTAKGRDSRTRRAW